MAIASILNDSGDRFEPAMALPVRPRQLAPTRASSVRSDPLPSPPSTRRRRRAARPTYPLEQMEFIWYHR